MMSKIVIFVCVALVASAVNASGTKDQFEAQQKQFQSYVTTNIAQIEEKYNTSITWEKTEEIITYMKSIKKKARDNVSNIKDKALIEFHMLIGQTPRSDSVLDCHQMRRNLGSKAKTFLDNVNECVADIRTAVITHLVDVTKESVRLRKSLMAYKNEIAACDNMFKRTQQVDDAFACTKPIEATNGPLIAESIKVLFTKLDGINDVLATFTSSLASCSSGYAVFEKAAADIITGAKECYRRVFA